MERVQNGPLARKARGQRSSLAAEMRDVTWKVHPGRSTEKPASPLQWDRDVEVSSSPTLSPSEASTLEGRFTWRASDIDEELWDPCTPQESPRAGVSTKCFTPPALSRAEMKDADVRPVQPNQITVFDGRSGLPQDVLRQPKLMVNHMRKHQDRPDILMQCCVWLQLQVAMGARERKGGAAASLVEAGVIEAVVDCMHRHSDKAKFQEAALWALWTLAAQECYLQQVTSSGAIEPIITAMRKHPHDAGVQEQAMWCVYWLTVKHIANRSEAVSLGASDLVSMAALNHRTVKSITDFVPTIQNCMADALAAEATFSPKEGRGQKASPVAASKSPSSPMKRQKTLLQKAAAAISMLDKRDTQNKNEFSSRSPGSRVSIQ